MSNLSECPKCGKRVLHVNVDKIVGLVDGESKAHGVSYSCIHCNAVLGVQMDALAKPDERHPSRDADATSS